MLPATLSCLLLVVFASVSHQAVVSHGTSEDPSHPSLDASLSAIQIKDWTEGIRAGNDLTIQGDFTEISADEDIPQSADLHIPPANWRQSPVLPIADVPPIGPIHCFLPPPDPSVHSPEQARNAVINFLRCRGVDEYTIIGTSRALGALLKVRDPQPAPPGLNEEVQGRVLHVDLRNSQWDVIIGGGEEHSHLERGGRPSFVSKNEERDRAECKEAELSSKPAIHSKLPVSSGASDPQTDRDPFFPMGMQADGDKEENPDRQGNVIKGPPSLIAHPMKPLPLNPVPDSRDTALATNSTSSTELGAGNGNQRPLRPAIFQKREGSPPPAK